VGRKRGTLKIALIETKEGEERCCSRSGGAGGPDLIIGRKKGGDKLNFCCERGKQPPPSEEFDLEGRWARSRRWRGKIFTEKEKEKGHKGINIGE